MKNPTRLAGFRKVENHASRAGPNGAGDGIESGIYLFVSTLEISDALSLCPQICPQRCNLSPGLKRFYSPLRLIRAVP